MFNILKPKNKKPKTNLAIEELHNITRKSRHERLRQCVDIANEYREAEVPLTKYATENDIDKQFLRLVVDLGEIVKEFNLIY